MTWQDLRHGARILVKTPGFSLVAIVSIAIGVGANAAMFSIADGMLLRPLQVTRASEIVDVRGLAPRASALFITDSAISYPDYVDLRDRARSFDGLLAYRVLLTSIARQPDQPAQSAVSLAVSGNFFDVLELQPALGRFFRTEEDQVPGRDAVVVLAHDFWTDQFGADPAVLDRRIRVGGVDFTIVGVAPASFEGMHLALHPAFYLPIAITPALPGAMPDMLQQRNLRGLSVKGRLAAGVSLEQAREEAALIARGLEQAYPDTNRNYGMLARTQFDARLEERGPSAQGAFLLITLAVLVLLVACANVAGLLLSRAPEREREIAVRLAIGGGRFRVTRQLITESLLLAAAGGALGLLMAYGGILLFRQRPMVTDIGVRLIFDLDRRAIAVGLVMAAVSALLSSLVPAWRATRSADLTYTLRMGRSVPGRPRFWGRNGLVAGQVALALVLLTWTAILSRAFTAELGRPGFRTERLLLTSFEPGLTAYDPPRTETFYRLLKERAQALPGVTSVGMTSVMPLNQDSRTSVTIVPEGYELPPDTSSLNVLASRIDEGYLDTMGIAIVRGRGISATDTTGTPLVALVNRAMAARYWPGQDSVGKRIRLPNRDGQPWAEVVGLTADNKYNWIGEAPTPWMYLSQRQEPPPRSTLIIATTGNAAQLASPLRALVRDLDPTMPIGRVRTMEEYYYGNATSLVTTLVGVTGTMGLLGLALAVVGLYGLVAHVVARRTREIGIRIAVGAPSGAVRRMVLRYGLMLATAGTLLGLAASVPLQRLARGVFPNTQSVDLVTYLLVVPTLVVVVMLAAYVPARRASRIDPLIALRQE